MHRETRMNKEWRGEELSSRWDKYYHPSRAMKLAKPWKTLENEGSTNRPVQGRKLIGSRGCAAKIRVAEYLLDLRLFSSRID